MSYYCEEDDEMELARVIEEAAESLRKFVSGELFKEDDEPWVYVLDVEIDTCFLGGASVCFYYLDKDSLERADVEPGVDSLE